MRRCGVDKTYLFKDTVEGNKRQSAFCIFCLMYFNHLSSGYIMLMQRRVNVDVMSKRAIHAAARFN